MNAPLPVPDALTRPYWEACRRNELRLQRCATCSRFVHFPGLLCPTCGGADLKWERVSGRGSIYTYVIIHRANSPVFRNRVPYAVAWIDLEEGRAARVLSDLVDCEADEVRIGAPVEVVFERLSDEISVPRFRLRR